MERILKGHTGEIYFRKNKFDVFSNLNLDDALEILNPDEVIVYGVALDVCNAYAVNGFLDKGKFQVSLVIDASCAIREQRAKQYLEQWRGKGVKLLETAEIMKFWKITLLLVFWHFQIDLAFNISLQ